MEVHHHSHTSRKKWTHYFWEFLMLFLAVFCRFLAEYQLEHTIEHNRERQFITTLVEDLKSDTAQLQSNVNYRKSRERMCDSLIIYLSDHKNKGNDIYFYARNLSRPQYFSPNDRTLQQLKNSGGLRLIRNLRVSDKIMSYDQDLRYLMTLSEDERSIRDGFREIVGTVFDGRILYSQIDTSDIANYTKPVDNPPLFMQDAGSINKTISSTQYLKSVIRGVRFRQERLKATATILLSFLQKEYNLE
ncbi:MAG TPA: hypothetical protein VF144_05450 [Chitinophagaceae bacterium]